MYIVISIHALRVEGDRYNADRMGLTTDISIHALRVEGDPHDHGCTGQHDISIHALRVEGDCVRHLPSPLKFISIHALRVEGDPARLGLPPVPGYFYPRPPGGGRRIYSTRNGW